MIVVKYREYGRLSHATAVRPVAGWHVIVAKYSAGDNLGAPPAGPRPAPGRGRRASGEAYPNNVLFKNKLWILRAARCFELVKPPNNGRMQPHVVPFLLAATVTEFVERDFDERFR